LPALVGRPIEFRPGGAARAGVRPIGIRHAFGNRRLTMLNLKDSITALIVLVFLLVSVGVLAAEYAVSPPVPADRGGMVYVSMDADDDGMMDDDKAMMDEDDGMMEDDKEMMDDDGTMDGEPMEDDMEDDNDM
jgi:hypothetical protein